MNYLAHLFLSGIPGDLLIGNFIADAVKGNKFELYNPEIKKGIILHRQIDGFTDSHPIVGQSKEKIRGRYGKLSGIIIDVFYDHFLAINWHSYSNILLAEYSSEIYLFLEKNKKHLPEKSLQFLEYMKRNNILCAYAEIKGIETVLKGLSQRLSFKPQMGTAVEELKIYYIEFEKEFMDFFPELILFAEKNKIVPTLP